MTRRSMWRLADAVVVLGLFLLAPVHPANAAVTLTWDSDGTYGNGVTDGNGTWDTTASNWYGAGPSDQAWNNGNNDIAQFGTGIGSNTAYSMSLGTGITVGGLTFLNQNYTVSGNTITLAGTPTITTNADGTIGSALAGTSGLTKAGPGTLTLAGANTYTGATVINAGKLVLPAIGSINSASTVSVNGSGALAIGQASNTNTLTLNGGTLAVAPRDNSGWGGTVTLAGANVVHSFTSGTSVLSVPTTISNANVLVVGGGGGGGGGTGGGGGAGGYIYNTGFTVNSGSSSVTVGAGGAGGSTGTGGTGTGSNGGNSVFGSLTAVGGGGGASNGVGAANGNPGGSGGGASNRGTNGTGGAGTGGQGNSGGDLLAWPNGQIYASGGGGGAGSAGTAGNGQSGGAAGGSGLSNSITGTLQWYAGGGGGGNYYLSGSGSGGAGGSGVGGSGGGNASTPTNGAANTGSGGGGQGQNRTTAAGSGGSGVVIVSYPYNANTGGISTTTLFGPINVASTSTLDAVGTGGRLTVASGMTGAGGINIASSSDPGGVVSFTAPQSYGGTTVINGGTLKLSGLTLVQPTAATAQSYYNGVDNRNPGNAIDGSGMTPSSPVTVAGVGGATASSTCGNAPAGGNMWLSDGTQATWVAFDLGSTRNLAGFHLWNYNETGSNFLGRGIKTADIYVGSSLPAAGSSYASQGPAWGTLAQSFSFDQATGANYTGSDYRFDTPVTGRYIEMYVAGNWNNDTSYTGVSEIRFEAFSGSSNLLPTGTAVQLGSAAGSPKLDLMGCTQQVASLADSGGFTNGIVTNSAADTPVTLTLSAASGTTTFRGSIDNAGGTINLVKAGNSIQVLAGTNTYTGATTVNGGTLVLAGASSNNIASSATISVSPGATLDVSGLSGGRLVLASGQKLLVPGTGTANVTGSLQPRTGLDMSGGNVGVLALSGALVLNNGDTLKMDVTGGGGADQITAASVTASGAITLNLVTNSPSGTYTLISAPGGGLTGGGATYPSYVYNNTNYTAFISATDTAVSYTSNTGLTPLASTYWKGGQVGGGNGNVMAISGGGTSNWASDAAGTATALVPGATADVYFSVTSGATNQNAVLGADMALNSLTFNDPTSVTIGAGNTLTIAAVGGTGITVNSGSAAHAINCNVALGADQTWTSNSANALMVGGVVSGAHALTKAGTGTVALTGANTYTGTTTISAGTLSTASVVVSGGASGLGNATSPVFLGDGSHQGTLSYTGNDASYTRGFTVNTGGGAINVANSGQTLTIATGAITGSGPLTIGGAGNTTLSSTVQSGVTGLNKTDSGTLTLGIPQSYSGTTVINGGTLKLSGAPLVQPVAATAQSYYGVDDRSPGHAIDGSGMTPSLPVTVVGVGGAVASSTCDTTPGYTMWLSNNTQATWIAFDLGSTRTLAGFRLWNYNESGAALGRGVKTAGIYVGSSLPSDGSSYATQGPAWGTLTKSFTFDKATGTGYTGSDCTFDAPVIGRYIEMYVTSSYGGTGSTDNYTGISEIRFEAFSSNILPTGTAVQLGAATGVAAIDLTGCNQQVASLADYGGFTNGIVTNSAAGTPATLTLSAASGTTTFGGSIDNAGGTINLVKAGGSTQVLAGTNTYTGATTVNGGTLALAGASSNNIASSATISISPGATLDVSGLSGGRLVLASSQRLLVPGTGTANVAGSLQAGSGLDMSSGSVGTLALSGALVLNGDTLTMDVTAGGADQITAASASASGAITLNLVTNSVSGTYTLISAPGGGLTSGGATYSLPVPYVYNNTTYAAYLSATDTAVSYTSSTGLTPLASAYWKGGQVAGGNGNVMAISDGITSNWASDAAGTATALVPGAGADAYFSVTSGATNQNAVLGADMTLNSLTFNDSMPVSIGVGNTLTIAAASCAGITVNSGSAAHAINCNVALGADQTWTNNSANALTVGGVVSGGHSLTKAGSGTLALTGANTYTGTTTISAGTLSTASVVVSGGASGLGNATSPVVLGDDSHQGTLNYTGSNATYTRGFTLSAGGGAINVATSQQTLTIAAPGITGSGPLTIGGAGNTTLASSVQSGVTGLTKTDGGTLVLSSANTYSGPTIINSGTLKLLQAPASNPLQGPGSGLQLWLDAADTATIDNAAGYVTLWNDKSGNAFNATVATGATSPSSGAAALNGHNAILFDGAQNTLVTSGTYAGKMMFVVAARDTTGANAFNGVVSARFDPNSMKAPASNSNLGFCQQGSGQNVTCSGLMNASNVWVNGTAASVAAFNGDGASGVPAWSAPIAGTVSPPSVIEVEVAGDTSGNKNLVIGADAFSAIGSRQFKGLIGEVLIYDTSSSPPLSNEQRQAIESYLSAKWLGVGTTGDILPSTTPVQIAAGATLDLNGAHQTIASLSGHPTLGAGSVSLGGGTLTVNGDANSEFPGAITGPGSVVKAGAGTMVLSGPNSFTGDALVTGGTLRLGAGGSLDPGTTVSVDGGTFDAGGSDSTVAGVSLLSGALVSTGGGQLISTSDFYMESGTASASLSGAVGLKKVSSGTVVLAGNNAYSEGTTVAAGTLYVQGAGALPRGGDLAIAADATVVLSGGASAAGASTGGVGQPSATVPEPGALALSLAAAAAGVFVLGRRRPGRTGLGAQKRK